MLAAAISAAATAYTATAGAPIAASVRSIGVVSARAFVAGAAVILGVAAIVHTTVIAAATIARSVTASAVAADATRTFATAATRTVATIATHTDTTTAATGSAAFRACFGQSDGGTAIIAAANSAFNVACRGGLDGCVRGAVMADCSLWAGFRPENCSKPRGGKTEVLSGAQAKGG